MVSPSTTKIKTPHNEHTHRTHIHLLPPMLNIMRTTTKGTSVAALARRPLAFLALVLLLLLGDCTHLVQAATRRFVQAQGPVVGVNNTQNAIFGTSSCLNKDGSVLAVGAPKYPNTRGEGTIYIYHYVKKHDSWVAAAGPIQPIDVAGVPATYFGSDLAINDKGNFLVVSAPRSIPEGTGSGSFYMYKMDKQFQWSQVGTAVMGTDSMGSNFGTSLALSGDGRVLVVGGTTYNMQGAIWIFTLNPKDGTYVEEAAHVQPSTGLQTNLGFGSDVAISRKGDVIVVSGLNYNVNEGAMWVYRFDKQSLTWVEEAGPLQPDGDLTGFTLGSFGNLDIDSKGNTIALGGIGQALATGGVYIFEHQKVGGTWEQTQGPIQGPDTDNNDDFGLGLTLDGSGKTLLVSAPSHGTFSEGAFYVFEKKLFKGFQVVQGPVVATNIEPFVPGFAETVFISRDGRVAGIGALRFGTVQGAMWTYVK